MPGKYLVKRLVALEGDWLYVPGRVDAEKIPKVPCTQLTCMSWRLLQEGAPRCPAQRLDSPIVPVFLPTP